MPGVRVFFKGELHTPVLLAVQQSKLVSMLRYKSIIDFGLKYTAFVSRNRNKTADVLITASYKEHYCVTFRFLFSVH